MKNRMYFGLMGLGVFLLSCLSVSAQSTFDSGSNGGHGALVVTTTSGTVTLTIPPDGKFHWTTVRIDSGATVKFQRNALNTPVYFLAQGDMVIRGTIDVGGKSGTTSPPTGGVGGPGGFDGGTPGIYGSVEPGAGHGPGGGLGGNNSNGYNDPNTCGPGSYGGLPSIYAGTNQSKWGKVYGSPLLVPLVGGSGAGGSVSLQSGQQAPGGGGGGGAILLASNTKVSIYTPGAVTARGGNNDNPGNCGQGSGGGIRIVAPVVNGNGSLVATGGTWGNSYGGAGRIRIDTVDRSGLQFSFDPLTASTVGAFMACFPPVVPKLDIISAAGTAIPEGTGNAVQVILPFDAPTTQTIRVQARSFKGVVPIKVVLIPDSGNPLSYDAEIDMNTGDPATVDVEVQMPKNILTYIYAWTR